MEWSVGGLRGMFVDVADAVRFLSRLPLPPSTDAPRALCVTLGVAPLAGLAIAGGPALILAGALVAGLPSLVAAALAVTALIAVTGALHEDGLADCADGFGGGSTRERKLAIMRDSRIGSYGALALGCGLLLRVGALQAMATQAGPRAALALLAAAVLSRTLMLLPLALLPPARTDGLAHRAGTPDGRTLVKAMILGLPLAGGLAFWGVSTAPQIIAGLLVSAAAAVLMTRLAQRQIGGVTGDVVGATQQAAETIFLIVLCATPSVA